MSTGVSPALIHSSRVSRDASCPPVQAVQACHGIYLLGVGEKPLWKPRKRCTTRVRKVVAQSSADDFGREKQRSRQDLRRFTDPTNGSGNWVPAAREEDAMYEDEDIVAPTPPLQSTRGRAGNGLASRRSDLDGGGKGTAGGTVRLGGNRYTPAQGAGALTRLGAQGGYPDGVPAATGRVPPAGGRRTGYGMVYGGSMEEDDFLGLGAPRKERPADADTRGEIVPWTAEEAMVRGVDVGPDTPNRRLVGAAPAGDADTGGVELSPRGLGPRAGSAPPAGPRGRGRPVSGGAGRLLADVAAIGSRTRVGGVARSAGMQGARLGKESSRGLASYADDEDDEEGYDDDDDEDAFDYEEEDENEDDTSSGVVSSSKAPGGSSVSGIGSDVGGSGRPAAVPAAPDARADIPAGAPAGATETGEMPPTRRRGRPRKGGISSPPASASSSSVDTAPSPGPPPPASPFPSLSPHVTDARPPVASSLPVAAANLVPPASVAAAVVVAAAVAATPADRAHGLEARHAASGVPPAGEELLPVSSPEVATVDSAPVPAFAGDAASLASASRGLPTAATVVGKPGSLPPASPSLSRIIKSELTVGSMVDRIGRGKLDVAPRFQRNYVWKLPAASKLVESVFMFAPIPTIFCCLGADGSTWEVVDGKQRLTTLWSFVKGEFPDGRPFVLNGLEVLPELNDKSFRDLDDAQRETLLDYSLSVHLLPAADLDPDYVFEVFERLNMGGMQLNAQELRNCMYHGGYKDLVEELVKHPLMRAICRSDTPQPRMKDHELVLRFFALLRNTPVNYRGPMKQWLNREARDFRNPSLEDVEVMRHEFVRVLKAAHRIFGENAFRVIRDDPPVTGLVPGEVNPAIWDMVLYTFSQYADLKAVVARKDDILAAFVTECRDGCLSGSLISQPTNMMERMSVWQKVMDGVMAKRDGREDSMF